METEKNKKSNNGIIILLLVIILLLISYIIFNQISVFNNNKTSNEEKGNLINNSNDIDNTVEDNNVVEEQKVCNGYISATYKGTTSYSSVKTLTLNLDGTYVELVENSESTVGTYKIENGVLTTTYEVPVDEYKSFTRKISNDCSTIEDEETTNLIKQ